MRYRTAPQGLAVDRYNLPFRHLMECLHPLDEALVEGAGIEHLKDAREGVVGGDVVPQSQEGLRPSFFLTPVGLDLNGGLATGDNPTQGDHQDVDEPVLLVLAVTPRIGKVIAEGHD